MIDVFSPPPGALPVTGHIEKLWDAIETMGKMLDLIDKRLQNLEDRHEDKLELWKQQDDKEYQYQEPRCESGSWSLGKD